MSWLADLCRNRPVPIVDENNFSLPYQYQDMDFITISSCLTLEFGITSSEMRGGGPNEDRRTLEAIAQFMRLGLVRLALQLEIHRAVVLAHFDIEEVTGAN